MNFQNILHSFSASRDPENTPENCTWCPYLPCLWQKMGEISPLQCLEEAESSHEDPSEGSQIKAACPYPIQMQCSRMPRSIFKLEKKDFPWIEVRTHGVAVWQVPESLSQQEGVGQTQKQQLSRDQDHEFSPQPNRSRLSWWIDTHRQSWGVPARIFMRNPLMSIRVVKYPDF